MPGALIREQRLIRRDREAVRAARGNVQLAMIVGAQIDADPPLERRTVRAQIYRNIVNAA